MWIIDSVPPRFSPASVSPSSISAPLSNHHLSPITYQESIEYLYSSRPAFHLVGGAAYKPGLDNTLRLMDALDHPERKFRSVHIAGTNGKGSTSHLIAASLQSMGLHVGLYTSPHLVDFRERIRLDGQMIPEQYVARWMTAHRELLDTIQPSFFETAMALCFCFFADSQVDIAVVEVGLGGRLDSTNIITPLLSVITNIGMDHTEYLGDTLAAIAREKAGIIKPGIPCVIGETHPETAPVFLAACEAGIGSEDSIEGTVPGVRSGGESKAGSVPVMRLASKIYFADQCEYLRRQRRKMAPVCELHGLYQEKNMQTAFVALRVLYPLLSPVTHHLSPFATAIAQGFASVCTLTGLRGRWETLSTSPLTICDTGHNSHGIRYVVDQLSAFLEDEDSIEGTVPGVRLGRRLHIVLGMVADKDIEQVGALYRQLPADRTLFYFTQAHTQRAVSAEHLSERLQLRGTAFSSVEEAIRMAQKNATPEDIIFIGGSNYVVGEALRLFPSSLV